MKWCLVTIVVCIGIGGFQLPVQTPVSKVSAQTNISESEAQSPTGLTDGLTDEEMCHVAESITVKVLSTDNLPRGSGILAYKQVRGQGWRYGVLTNAHVVPDKDSYRIETADDRSYPAEVVYSFARSSSGNDLALLQFESPVTYNSAILGTGSSLNSGDRILAAGFPLLAEPSGSRGFTCLSGSVSLVLDREMRQGYQIGYYVDVEKGMSGGPLVNSRGEVVGINGKHSYPLPFGTGNQNPYEYKDGTLVSQSRELLESSSWAIPIEILGRTENP